MKFPDRSIKLRYADYWKRLKNMDPDVSEFDILDEFMKWEKDIQQDMLKMDPLETDKKSGDSKNKDKNMKCQKCGQMGHRRANCSGSSSTSRSSGG